MKTILTTIAIVALALASCKKNEKLNPKQKYTVLFVSIRESAGGISSSVAPINGRVSINNDTKTINVKYEAESGDVLTFTDRADSTIHLANPTTGALYWVEYFSYQDLISIHGADGSVVNKDSGYGQGKCNLTYTLPK